MSAAIKVRIVPITETEADWDDWLSLFANRNEVAAVYAEMLRSHAAGSGVYASVNQAIVRRWSMAGLRYIKERAWKIAREEASS